MELSRPLVHYDPAQFNSPGAGARYAAAWHAALQAEDPVVKRLLEAGADPNARSADYRPGSAWSAAKQMVLRMIHHAPPVPSDWTSVLGHAAEHDAAQVQAVLAHGGNPRLPVDSGGSGALSRAMEHLAGSKDGLAVLKLLFKYGANARSRDGANAVAEAASSGDAVCVALLIQHGADCRTGRSDGLSPVQLAIRKDHADVLVVLLEHGAIVDRSEEGQPDEESARFADLFVLEVDPFTGRTFEVSRKLGEVIEDNARNPEFKGVAKVLRAHGIPVHPREVPRTDID
jgi:hypothetical protein